MESDMPLSEILERLARGAPMALSLLFSTTPSDYLKYAKEMTEEKWPARSTVTHLSDYRFTLSLSQLFLISSLYETLAKRLEFLRQRLTVMGDSELHITLPELRQVDFHLALMILEVEEISRTLKSAYAESSSQTPA